MEMSQYAHKTMESFSIDNFFAFVCFSPYIRKKNVLLSQNVSLCQPSTGALLTG